MTPNTQDPIDFITRNTVGMSDQQAATWALSHSYSFARAVFESDVAAVDAIVFLWAVQEPDDQPV